MAGLVLTEQLSKVEQGYAITKQSLMRCLSCGISLSTACLSCISIAVMDVARVTTTSSQMLAE